MALVTTSVKLCNLALARLGQDPITTIGESTREGQLCDAVYETTRDALLRSHSWNFAVQRVTLAVDGGVTPSHEYLYAYALPSSPYCLKVIRTSIEADGYEHDYRVEGRYIYTDETAFSIEYIARVTSVAEYDPLFIQVLALDLAIAMCMPLADNASLLAELTSERKALLLTAQSVDAQEGKSRDVVDANGWLYARI